MGPAYHKGVPLLGVPGKCSLLIGRYSFKVVHFPASYVYLRNSGRTFFAFFRIPRSSGGNTLELFTCCLFSGITTHDDGHRAILIYFNVTILVTCDTHDTSDRSNLVASITAVSEVH